MENAPTPQNSQTAPNNTDNNTTSPTLDAIDQAIAVNNIVTQANNIINRTTVDATKSIFEYTLKGNPYLYTIKQEFNFNDDFINLLKEETVRASLSNYNIQHIVQNELTNQEDQRYILNNYKPLDKIVEDGCMTYEQFLILSFLISHATATHDTGLTINLKKAQQIIETGAKQINDKQQTLQKVGSVVGDVSTVIGIIGSALTLSRIFWTAMPAGLFYVSLAIAITFSLYTLITRLINLYRSSQMQKNSAEINRLSKLSQQMRNTFIDKVKNAQQNGINDEREKWKAESKGLENQAYAVQQKIAQLQQVRLQQHKELQQTQEQNQQLLEKQQKDQQQIQQMKQENDQLKELKENNQAIIKELKNNIKICEDGLQKEYDELHDRELKLEEANKKIKQQETTINQLMEHVKANAKENGKLKNPNQNNKNKNNTSNKNKTNNATTNQDSDDDYKDPYWYDIFDEDSTNNAQAVSTKVNAQNNTLNKTNQPNQQIIKSSTASNTTKSNTAPKQQNSNTSNSKNKLSQNTQQPAIKKKYKNENDLALEYNQGHKNIKYKNKLNLAKLNKQKYISMCDDGGSGSDSGSGDDDSE